jgi:signal transduction histidine kinase
MNKLALLSHFAPAERASSEEIQRQHHKLNHLTFIKEFLDSVPSMSLILNSERQIVYANQSFLKFLGVDSFPEYLGKRHGELINCINTQLIGRRPGEALHCAHASECNGCGTTLHCRTCGALATILKSTENAVEAVDECRMTRLIQGVEQALDLKVWSRPIELEGETFTIFSVQDISHEKRRRALENIFFHDVMNTAGNMQGITALLLDSSSDEREVHELAGLLHISTEELIDEINAQKVLSAAESGELTLNLQTIHAKSILELVAKQYSNHPVADRKQIVINPDAEAFTFISDPTLLRRILGNLVKNGLEASRAGHTVLLNCQLVDQQAIFSVQNAMVMSMEVQLQIFNRSFSTKGTGRGLGTYSIKLLTERYLSGHVSFLSADQIGTLFKITLPLKPAES